MSEKLCYDHNKIHVYMKSECPWCEIDRLKGELEQVKYDRAIKHDMAAEQIEELERQLAEKDKQLFEENLQVKRLETANLALRSERDQAVAQLHAELAEAKQIASEKTVERARLADQLAEYKDALDSARSDLAKEVTYNTIQRIELEHQLAEANEHRHELQAVAQLHAELAEARAEVGYTTQAIRR